MSNHIDDQDYEISLTVGSVLAVTPQEDRDAFEEEREKLSQIQDILRESGVVVDLLANPGAEIWEGGIKSYGHIYRLRQIAAYVERGRDISQLLVKTDVDIDEDIDPLLAAIFADEESTQYPHLITHPGDRGYYLPIEFSNPIWIEDEAYMDEVTGDDWEDDEAIIAFGSSTALQRELHTLSMILNQLRVSSRNPVMQCLNTLREAVSISVQNDLPLIIW